MKRFLAASSAEPAAKQARLPRPAAAPLGGAGGSAVDERVTKDDKDGWTWHGALMFYEHKKTQPSDKIAAFDYDGTLANTSLFNKGPDAWSILFPKTTEEVLRELHGKGYKLVIMTNQAAIGKAKASFEKTLAEKKARLVGFAKKVDLPVQIFCATANEAPYRKPDTGMFDFLERFKNNDIKVDRARSFFAGDAAGRKKDHSDSDLKFAEAYGVRFFTEEQMFKDKEYQAFV